MRPPRATGRSGTERSDILTGSRFGFMNRLPIDGFDELTAGRLGALSLLNGQAGA